MKRDEVLASLGIGLAAACTGCLYACSKSGDDEGSPAVIPPPKPPTNVSLTVDLNNELRNVGDNKILSGIIIVRIAEGNDPSSFTAVQSACTHEGTTIGYSANQGRFVCPGHGSQFTTTGAVQNGPATSNLKKYTVSISGSTLTISG